ncbi:MAG TPA: peptidoglycan-associated lipoprotein Pal [Candidatus Eisenbacteria bacterium]|jgi:peptidoglycan-associated lipoprotein|nr:peptidoglycan-associated lipoprotein Pal [Candidatus Eisenbacteria bacterium]
MRRMPRIATLALAALLFGMLAGLGCSSRKQVTTADTTPPPPPPTETTTPPPPPSEPPSETTAETNTATGLEDAFFDYDAADIRNDAKDALTNNGKYLSSHGSSNIVIEGHCDERGSVEYNLALGERRARAAKDFLVSYGVPATRLTTISYGKERPFDAGHDESAWAKNRRAHFVSK